LHLIDLLLILGTLKFLKLITLDYEDMLDLMHLHPIFLNILIKYTLCNNVNTPSTYSIVVNINPNTSEFVTPRVTETITKSLKLQWSLKTRANQVIEVWNQNSKSRFKFCLVWTDWPRQEILRIYWSQIRPYPQKQICSWWLVLHVYKSKKIMEVRKYLFQDPNRDNQLSLQNREIFSRI
jgi:hypothetical protein